MLSKIHVAMYPSEIFDKCKFMTSEQRSQEEEELVSRETFQIQNSKKLINNSSCKREAKININNFDFNFLPVEVFQN